VHGFASLLPAAADYSQKIDSIVDTTVRRIYSIFIPRRSFDLQPARVLAAMQDSLWLGIQQWAAVWRRWDDSMNSALHIHHDGTETEK
jgi:hypothetical protein